MKSRKFEVKFIASDHEPDFRALALLIAEKIRSGEIKPKQEQEKKGA